MSFFAAHHQSLRGVKHIWRGWTGAGPWVVLWTGSRAEVNTETVHDLFNSNSTNKLIYTQWHTSTGAEFASSTRVCEYSQRWKSTCHGMQNLNFAVANLQHPNTAKSSIYLWKLAELDPHLWGSSTWHQVSFSSSHLGAGESASTANSHITLHQTGMLWISHGAAK